MSEIKKTLKLNYYLGWRGNPQLKNGGYYKAYGQITKKSVKEIERCVYGSMSLTPYTDEKDYLAAIEKAKNDGYSVR